MFIVWEYSSHFIILLLFVGDEWCFQGITVNGYGRALLWKRFHMEEMNKMFKQIYQKNIIIENNLAMKHLLAQSLFW